MAASTTILTAMTSVVTTAPTAATKALALAPAGPIQSPQGNAQLALLKLQEAKVLLTTLAAATDAGDPNLTNINNVLLTLS